MSKKLLIGILVGFLLVGCTVPDTVVPADESAGQVVEVATAIAQDTLESEAAEQATPESIPAAEPTDEQLFTAIIAKDADAVKQALEAGANPNAVNSLGTSALFRAVRSARVSGNTDIIELLLEFGADVNGHESDGKPTLPEAVVGGSIEIAQVLLVAGADASVKMPLQTYYPVPFIQAPILMEPISKNDIEMVELLIEHGADVNQVEQSFQYTPLHYAAELNLPEIIKILLDNGSDPTQTQRQYSETPLHTAVIGYTEAGSVKAIQALLDGGVDVDIRAASMMTPIMYMLFNGNPSQMTEIVTMLLDGGADLTSQDVNGDTALHYAARQGRSEVIPLLIEHGAVLDMENDNGETALDIAVNDQIAAILREAGVKE